MTDQDDLVHLLFNKMARDMETKEYKSQSFLVQTAMHESMMSLEKEITNPYHGVIATLSLTQALNGRTMGLLVFMLAQQLKPEAFIDGETEEDLQMRLLEELVEIQSALVTEAAKVSLLALRNRALKRAGERS